MNRLALILLPLSAIFAQSPEFEAASIKPGEGANNGMLTVRRQVDTSHLSYLNFSLHGLIEEAWSVRPWQVEGPDWLESTRYTVEATLPPGTSEARAMLMLQTFLKERLGVQTRKQPKERAVYALSVLPSGIKFQKSNSDHTGMRLGVGHIVANQITMAQFATVLSGHLDRPVINSTGIDGIYDLVLDWKLERSGLPDVTDADPGEKPSIFTALRDQLGLRLDSRRAPIDTVIVEHAEKIPKE